MATFDDSPGGRGRREGPFRVRNTEYPAPEEKDSLYGEELEMAKEQGNEQDERATAELGAAIKSGKMGAKEETVEDIMRWSEDEVKNLTQSQLDDAIKVLKTDRDKNLYSKLHRASGGEKSHLFALLNERNIQNIKLLEARARFDTPIEQPANEIEKPKWWQFWKKKQQ